MSDAVTLTTTPKAFCFVLMPFDQSFDDVYKLGIKEACSRAGAYCERVDEQIFHESILQRIYNQIAKADFIVADMTGRNPNVFYEVGYAHALGKRTILLTKKADDIPFDLKHFPHIVYGESIVSLRDELTKRVKWFVDNPPDDNATGKNDLELYVGTMNLARGPATYQTPEHQWPIPRVAIRNASTRTIEPGEFKLALIMDRLYTCADQRVRSISLPTGEHLHMTPDFDALLPEEYAFYDFLIHYDSAPDQFDVKVRLFTSTGTRDYDIKISP